MWLKIAGNYQDFFVQPGWSRNKFLPSKGSRMRFSDPNEFKFKLQIIQVMHLAIFEKKITKIKVQILLQGDAVIDLKHLIWFISYKQYLKKWNWLTKMQNPL